MRKGYGENVQSIYGQFLKALRVLLSQCGKLNLIHWFINTQIFNILITDKGPTLTSIFNWLKSLHIVALLFRKTRCFYIPFLICNKFQWQKSSISDAELDYEFIMKLWIVCWFAVFYSLLCLYTYCWINHAQISLRLFSKSEDFVIFSLTLYFFQSKL
jgi:uncharacterized membrane protein